MTPAIPHPPTKVCQGPAHPGPTRLPLTAEHWNFYRSGPRAGTPIGRCRLCHHWNALVVKSGPHGLVDAKPVLPFVVELVERCGNPEKVYAAHGLHAETLRSIIAGQRSVRKRTVARLLLALSEQRKYDRRNGASERFVKARREQGLREERALRLAGY
jgi:hypothetical protein